MWQKCSGEDGKITGITGDGWERGTRLEEEVSIGWRAFTQALEGAILEPGGRTAFAHHLLTRPASPLHFLSAYVLFLDHF